MAKKLTVNCTTGEVEEVEMTGAELAAHEAQRAIQEPPPPPAPNYGPDLPANYAEQVADTVTNLRQYLGAASPTLAQTAVALKLLIRLVFFLARRAL